MAVADAELRAGHTVPPVDFAVLLRAKRFKFLDDVLY
jgi:hypothetical protein